MASAFAFSHTSPSEQVLDQPTISLLPICTALSSQRQLQPRHTESGISRGLYGALPSFLAEKVCMVGSTCVPAQMLTKTVFVS